MTFGFKPKPIINSNRAIPILENTSIVWDDSITLRTNGPTIMPVIMWPIINGCRINLMIIDIPAAKAIIKLKW